MENYNAKAFFLKYKEDIIKIEGFKEELFKDLLEIFTNFTVKQFLAEPHLNFKKTKIGVKLGRKIKVKIKELTT